MTGQDSDATIKFFLFFKLTCIHISCNCRNLCALAMHAPAQNQNSVDRGLKNVQTDKTTLFYADNRANRSFCVEMVLPGTVESKAATEHLKFVAATL